MSDLLIAGGTLVSDAAAQRQDLLIRDGQVAALVEPGTCRDADTVLDATGLHVLPGVVDAHVHFNEPGRTDWEGFLTGTTAAAAGGVTTVCEMPLNAHPPTLDGRALALKQAAVEPHALVDYAFWGGVVPGSLHRLAELKGHGVVGVKGFMCDSGLPEFPPLDEFDLLEAMQVCAELDLLLALHAEDAQQTLRLASAARAAFSQTQPQPQTQTQTALDWARSRPAETEVAAVERALEAAAATGARVHVVHVSTAAAVRLIASARATGVDVSCETCPHYLVLDECDLERLGALGKCAPPLRPRAVVEELWQTVLAGSVDLVASDHSPCPPDMKRTPDIWSAWGGLAGVQTTLPALLTYGVHGRDMPLSRCVGLLSSAPARRLGLFPRKGTLQPGADADCVLIDLEREWTLEPAMLRTRWPLNPFLGRTFRGAVVMTLVRGTMVYRDGHAVVAAGHGRRVLP